MAPGPRADNPPGIAPAGTVHCALADWAKFVGLHLRGARNELSDKEAKIIRAETIRRLQQPPAGADYACGWAIAERDWGGRVLTHSGSNAMWFAVVWMAPEKDFAVLVVTNVGNEAARKACDEAAGALIQKALEMKPQ